MHRIDGSEIKRTPQVSMKGNQQILEKRFERDVEKCVARDGIDVRI